MDTWLKKFLDEIGWSQADLAREMGRDTAVVSNIYNGKRNAGPEFILDVAHATKRAPEALYRRAGLLPPISPGSAKEEELAHIASELPETALDDLLEFARHRLHLAEKRGEYHAEKHKSP